MLSLSLLAPPSLLLFLLSDPRFEPPRAPLRTEPERNTPGSQKQPPHHHLHHPPAGRRGWGVAVVALAANSPGQNKRGSRRINVSGASGTRTRSEQAERGGLRGHRRDGESRGNVVFLFFFCGVCQWVWLLSEAPSHTLLPNTDPASPPCSARRRGICQILTPYGRQDIYI